MTAQGFVQSEWLTEDDLHQDILKLSEYTAKELSSNNVLVPLTLIGYYKGLDNGSGKKLNTEQLTDKEIKNLHTEKDVDCTVEETDGNESLKKQVIHSRIFSRTENKKIVTGRPDGLMKKECKAPWGLPKCGAQYIPAGMRLK